MLQKKSPKWVKWLRLALASATMMAPAQELEVKVGDKVLYSKYAGTDIKLGGDEYILLTEKDILAIVD